MFSPRSRRPANQNGYKFTTDFPPRDSPFIILMPVDGPLTCVLLHFYFHPTPHSSFLNCYSPLRRHVTRDLFPFFLPLFFLSFRRSIYSYEDWFLIRSSFQEISKLGNNCFRAATVSKKNFALKTLLLRNRERWKRNEYFYTEIRYKRWRKILRHYLET